MNNTWDWLFLYYAAACLIGCVIAVGTWSRKSEDRKIRRQAKLVIFSLLVSVAISSAADILFNPTPFTSVPKFAPFFFMIPISAFYYLMQRDGMMMLPISHKKQENVLSDKNRRRIFSAYSILILAVGIQSILSELIRFKLNIIINPNSSLLTGSILFLLGVFLRLMQQLRNAELKFTFSIGIILLSIPVVTLRYTESALFTGWVFPILLIIISLLFNSRALLIAITAMAILTQTFSWIHATGLGIPNILIDFLLRIVIYLAAFLIGFYVNRIYSEKLHESAQQIGFQQLISDCSFDFMTINQENLDERALAMLQRVTTFFEVDRATIILFDNQAGTVSCKYEWCKPNISSIAGTVQNLPRNAFAWWLGQIENAGIIHIEDTRYVSEEAKNASENLRRNQIQSVLSLAIKGNGTVFGCLSMDSVLTTRKWTDDHINMLKVLSNLLADGFTKIKAEKEIEYMAYYDQLTGIPNRSFFTDKVRQAIACAKADGQRVAILFLDLDGFKTINDTLGHAVGDTVIRNVADAISAYLGENDLAARIGGDEFLIMFSRINPEQSISPMVNGILQLFGKPFHYSEQEHYVTASIGVAVYPDDGTEAETLIQNADIAMYKAKSKGKNQAVLCDAYMMEEIQHNSILSNSLYRAQERKELMICYQPQVSLHTGDIVGFEALVRWNHPTMGMIQPSQFIPLAEKNGMINSIGEWVLRTACRQDKQWQEKGLPFVRMGINLSVTQFLNPKLVDVIGDVLRETGLDPEYLDLEITESVANNEDRYVADLLARLKQIGVMISLDDFGTEYSSLSRLKALPIDCIKIDMQFIQGLDRDEKDRAITQVIINLAKSLGLQVIAEGVETAAQLEFLIQKSCDDVQGFYFFQPMPADEAEHLLMKRAPVFDPSAAVFCD